MPTGTGLCGYANTTALWRGLRKRLDRTDGNLVSATPACIALAYVSRRYSNKSPEHCETHYLDQP
jgi:hypothetical protein